MVKPSIKRAVMLFAVAAVAVIGARSVTHAQQTAPTVVRKVLLQQDLTIPGYQAALVPVEISVGGREGRHTHPGTLLVHVQEGALTLDYEGRPTVTYKAGGRPSQSNPARSTKASTRAACQSKRSQPL